MKTLTKWMMLLVLLTTGVAIVGCEAEGKIDDDGVELDIDD